MGSPSHQSKGQPMSEVSTRTAIVRPRVLFVCTGNTCRSVLAEYIARKKFDRLIDPSSAGLQPGTVEDTDNAIYTLKEFMGVDASGHLPRDVRTVDVEHIDLIITMSNLIADRVRQLFPNLPMERLVRWRIKDPYGDNLAEYRRCAQCVYAEMKKLPILANKP
jgi:protein-tyrosine-phosphatase